jgi:hypothetical protein
MDYLEFLTRVIDDGIAGARKDYEKHPAKLAGAVAGFEACRGRVPADLFELLVEARKRRVAACASGNTLAHGMVRCFEAEVAWVCNVVSAVLMNERRPVIVAPTARGFMKAATIVGVAGLFGTSLPGGLSS